MTIAGLLVGLIGFDSSFIPACNGVRPPLRELHARQQQTMFSQVVFPPRDRGTTWSKLSWLAGRVVPQY